MIHLILILLSSVLLFSQDVVITIQPGTSENSLDWNDPENPLKAKVGDTLVIINNDSESHQLHTAGRPCKHGDSFAPNEIWSCVLETEYSSFEEDEPLRDHMNYDSKVWLIVEKMEN